MIIKESLRRVLLENDISSYDGWWKANMKGPLDISEVNGNLVKEVNPEMMISNFKQYSEIINSNKIYKR